MKIDWRRQMMEFLKNHNWKEIEKGMIAHPLFPLIEDVSSDELLKDFVENFYKSSWECYKSLVNYHAKEMEECEVIERLERKYPSPNDLGKKFCLIEPKATLKAYKEAQAIMKKKVDALKNICNEKFNSVHDYGVFERESDKIFGEEMGNE